MLGWGPHALEIVRDAGFFDRGDIGEHLGAESFDVVDVHDGGQVDKAVLKEGL